MPYKSLPPEIFEAVFDAIIAINKSLNITYFNQSACDLFGYTSKEIIGQSLNILLPERFRKIHEEHMQKFATSSDTRRRMNERGVIVGLKKDGTEFFAHAAIVKYQKDGETMMAVTIMDITRQKKAEDALRISEANLKSLLESTLLSFILVGSNYRVKLANHLAQERSKAVFGKDMREGDLIYDFVHEHDRKDFDRDFKKALSGQSLVIERSFVAPDGSDLHFEFQYSPVKTDDGELLGVCLITGDITERKRSEIALRQADEIFRQLTENIDDIFFLRDPIANKMVYISPAYEKIWGYSRETLYQDSRAFVEAVHPDDRSKVIQQLRQQEEAGVPFNMEYRIVRPDGEVRRVWANSFQILNEKGELYRQAGIVKDITEHREAERRELELEKERERARILADFISNASHEFKTPLSVIGTRLYLLENTIPAEQERQRGYVQSIKDHTTGLELLVNALMAMARLDSQETTTDDFINLNAVLEKICTEMQDRIEAQKQVFQTDYMDNIPTMKGDGENITLALRHMIDNAMRYTPKGGQITVRTHTQDKYILVEIQDTGIGISKKHLPRIFERFFRVDEAHATRGFGLGLSIAQKVVELHGGHIDVKSEPEKGSLFTVYLPFKVTGSLMPD